MTPSLPMPENNKTSKSLHMNFKKTKVMCNIRTEDTDEAIAIDD